MPFTNRAPMKDAVMNYQRKLLVIAIATGLSGMPPLGSAAATFMTSKGDAVSGNPGSLSVANEASTHRGPYASFYGHYDFRTGSARNETKGAGTQAGPQKLAIALLDTPEGLSPPARSSVGPGNASSSIRIQGSVASYNPAEHLVDAVGVGGIAATQMAASSRIAIMASAAPLDIDRAVRLDGFGSTEIDAMRFDTVSLDSEPEAHRASAISVPEPAPFALLALGLFGIGLLRKRSKSKV